MAPLGGAHGDSDRATAPGAAILDTDGTGRAYALVNAYALDGRVSSHPVTAHGWTTMNCYALVEADAALLFSTGYSIHQDSLLEQLRTVVGARPLSLVIPRVEFAAMCNARPIADAFDVRACYQRFRIPPARFLNFRPQFASPQDGLRRVVARNLSASEPIAVGSRSSRSLLVLFPQLRILPCNWAYDAATRTLFTGDIFSWVWHADQSGPWRLAGAADDPTTANHVRDFLVNNRYWWLAGAVTGSLRRSLSEVFDGLDVRTIAPDHGAILQDDAIVRHYELLDTALRGLESEEPIGPTLGARPLRETA